MDLSLAWGLATGINNLGFEGWADFIGAKGVNEAGVATQPETHINASLMYDVSPAFGASKNTFKLGAGYEYWKNKFGNNNALAANNGGAFAKTPFIKGEYHVVSLDRADIEKVLESTTTLEP